MNFALISKSRARFTDPFGSDRALAGDLRAFALRYYRSALIRAAIEGPPPPPPLGPDPADWPPADL